jgi:hypothetical protein
MCWAPVRRPGWTYRGDIRRPTPPEYWGIATSWIHGVELSQWAAVISHIRPFRRVLFVIVIGAILTGCTTQKNQPPSSTSTTRAATTPTTTVALPGAPQPSAEAAAAALISSWATGNRPEALSVATSAAVTTLFAAPYTSGLAIDRGCNSNPPIVCAYGPPGGAPPTDPLYELYATNEPSGWYISSVQIDN